MSPTVSLVIDTISTNTKLSKNTLSPDTLLGTLAIPSLDVLQIVFDLEQKLGVTVPDTVAEELPTMTVGAVAQLLDSLRDVKPRA
jgi:acyl carrier protein